MGLDQYFYIKVYRSEFYKEKDALSFPLEDQDAHQALLSDNYDHYLNALKLFDMSDLSPLDYMEPFSYNLTVEFAYLRKCWPIHHWIINNYPNSGNLDPYNDSFYLGFPILEKLKNACDNVILDRSLAHLYFKYESISYFEYDELFFNKLIYLSQKLSIILNLQDKKTFLVKYSYSC
jgi:hypothetical protein